MHTLFAIVTYIITLLIGIFVDRIFENKTRLITFFGHIAAGQIKTPDNQVVPVFTHSIVIKNSGQKSATNIRIKHKKLPQHIKLENMIAIYPANPYKISQIPNGGEELCFERLLPREQLTITYVYFPPLKYDLIIEDIKSDECLARRINVSLNRLYPIWFLTIVRIFLLIGIVTVLYLVVIFIKFFFNFYSGL